MSCNFVALLRYIVVVTPLSSVYRIMFVICDALASPDLVIKHILSYLYLILSNHQPPFFKILLRVRDENK